MISEYRFRLDAGEGRPADDLVMIASLAYMRHDLETARRAAEEAIETGDRLHTTRLLLDAIGEQPTP